MSPEACPNCHNDGSWCPKCSPLPVARPSKDEVFWAIPVDAASEADSVRCVRVEDYERLRGMLGKYPERAQLCHDGHDPIVHFSDCPICVDEDLSLKASKAAPETTEAHDAVRYRWLRDWYHREGRRSEIDPDGHVAVRTLAEWEGLLDAAIARGPAMKGSEARYTECNLCGRRFDVSKVHVCDGQPVKANEGQS